MKVVSIIFLFFTIAPLIMRCSFNIGNLGLLILSVCFYLLEINIMIMRNLIVIVLAISGIIFCFNSYKMLKAISITPKGDETLIVLGCGVYGTKPSLALIERMNQAISFMRKNENVLGIVSGGQGRLEDISEAECMYSYMINQNIDNNRIYREDKSRNTDENIRYSKKIIEDNNMNNNVALVTQTYHMYRAMRIAHKYGLKSYAIRAKSRWYAVPCYWLREVIAIFYIDTLAYLKK